jgi:hypothetical protein
LSMSCLSSQAGCFHLRQGAFPRVKNLKGASIDTLD